MKQPFPCLAKRTLALVLALVLLLTVFPVVALAAEESWSDDPDFQVNSKFKDYITELTFRSGDSDLIFEDDQPYDWSVRFKHSFPGGLSSGRITATVTDASGNIIDTFTNKGHVNSGTTYTVVSSTYFSELTNDLYGNFTLTVEVDNGGTFVFSMTKTFSRVDTTPEATEPTEPEEIESTIVATVTSRSNPDNVFTFADPIDLVLNIKKNDGKAAAYNAAITVTKKGSTEVLDSYGVSLPSSTNISLILKDYLKKLPSITTTGIYSVNLTLADSTGPIAHQCSTDFAVVALEGSVTATVTSATNPDFIFNNAVPDLQINLQENDGIAENLTTVVKVTDGTSTWTQSFTTSSANDTLTPDLSSLPKTGNYTLTATITDDAGNLRGSVSVSFSRTNVTPMTGWLIDYSPDVTGKIYSDGSDFNLSLSINHAASARKVVTVKAVGTLNGKPFVSTKRATLNSMGAATVTINGAMLSAYGIFEDISIEVYDASGNRMWKSAQSYSFARVLDTSTPGDLPLLNINDHFTKNKGEGTLKIPLAAQAGANMWRSTIPWATVEDSKGQYSFSVADSVMDDTKNNKMQALIILAYGNDEIYGTPNPTNSTWLNAYANYCYRTALYMAQNYPDDVVGFEIWNEWNHASMSKVPSTYRTGAYYAMVVKAASAKIRQVNSECGTNFKVIAGATAGDGYDNEGVNTFIKQMFNASGFFAAVDGVSFHTYSSVETTSPSDEFNNIRRFEYVSPAAHDFAARISNYNNLVNKYNKTGKDIEIWLTETGWTTNSEPEYGTGTTDGGKTHITYGATEEDAAAYLVQMYAWALYDGTLDRIFWYDFMNDISNQTKIWANNQTESNYGLIHNWNNSGDQPLAYSAKAGYVTMCALASKLGGATNGKQIHINNDSNIYAYQFTKNGKYITVMWAEGDSKTVNLTLSKDITVSDMYGNATTYKAGSVTLTLTGAPIYLEYASGAISFG